MPLPTHFTLNTGARIPAVGYGTWLAAPNEVEEGVMTALKAGYRHIDAAHIYQNEAEVGAGLRRSGTSRNEVFITSKLWNNSHHPDDVEAALDVTLKNLGTDYVDLYLIHWPVSFKNRGKLYPLDENGVFELDQVPDADTWAALEKLVATGKTRAIGVSNFTQARLEKLLQTAKIVPAVNQIEAHPWLQQRELTEYAKSKGILIEAYSPLGNNVTGERKIVDDPVVQDLAASVGQDPGQLLVSWAVQRGTVVLPKSVTPERIRTNLLAAELPADVFAKLNALERGKRFNLPKVWGFNVFDEEDQAELDRIAREAGPDNLKKYQG